MLKEKVAIVTGGSRGIGLAIYKKCVEEGAKVVICSRNIEEINKAIDTVDKDRANSDGIRIDVSNLIECKKLIDFTMKKFGRIDILINNAGIYGPIGLLETNEMEQWLKTIEINLMGTVYCSNLVLPLMRREKSGKIINMAGAGVGGVNPPARFSAYYSSKMALVGFTESLAKEVENENIQINCISPGGVNTAFTDFLLSEGIEKVGKEMYEQAKRQKESGGDSPELAANMVAFLASDRANHISSKIISAKWDEIEFLSRKDGINKNLFNLRRIDNKFFYEKTEK
jgi:3-oxoacyl-[acyl-carrier protein] reductase